MSLLNITEYRHLKLLDNDDGDDDDDDDYCLVLHV